MCRMRGERRGSAPSLISVVRFNTLASLASVLVALHLGQYRERLRAIGSAAKLHCGSEQQSAGARWPIGHPNTPGVHHPDRANLQVKPW
jgi:hypothetical protein